MTQRVPSASLIEAEQGALVDFVTSAEVGLHWVAADGTIVWANPADYEPLGYTAEEYIGHNISEFHADPGALEDILERLAAGERLREREARLLAKDGSIRTVRITSSVLFDEQGRFVHTRCFTRDVTELERAQHAAREQAAELQLITDSLPALVAHVGPDLRYRFVNESYTRWFGLRREDVVGRSLSEVLGADTADKLRPHVDAALAGRPTVFEAWIPYAVGGLRYVRASYIPKRTTRGEPDGYIALIEDLTDEKLAGDRAQVLAQTGDVLSSSLDYETTLASLALLLVPRLADWSAVEMLDEGGAPRQVAVAHVDPEKLELARAVRERFPPDPDAGAGVSHVLRTGQAELVEDISDDFLEQHARGPEHLRIVRELGLRSYLIVPISLRGRIVGALALMSAGSRRRYGPADLEIAQAIADRAALAIENARLFTQAQEATRRKDEFLAMLGHELRNPLAPILTALRLMELKDSEATTTEREIIARQVRHLVRLVDDLLDVSRITSGKIELERRPLEIAGVLTAAIEMASPLLEQKRHHLSVDVPRRGLVVEADPLRLAQVFANLLTNAAKYTQPGGRIDVRASRHGGQVEVEISDDGIGIEPEMLGRIFDLFVQGPQAIDRAGGGLGIGLRLARSLIELQGGRISAQSEGPGRGSRFVVRLPLLSGAAARQLADPSENRERVVDGAVRRVLIVDDNADAAHMLAVALRKAGHVVHVALDAPAALEHVDADRPDIALLDIGLPVMDGYELAQRLRAQCGDGVRLLAITGYGTDGDRERSRAAGFQRHFVKPLELDELLLEIAGDTGRATAAADPAP